MQDGLLGQEREPADRPRLLVGYGTADRLVNTYGPLVDSVPPQQVLTRDGGHRWSTWERLWRTIEASGAISQPLSPEAG